MGQNPEFTLVKQARVKSNKFDLSHDVKLSCGLGKLIPIMCMEAMPGDKFRLGAEGVFRTAPQIAPMMHRVDVTMHYYFVPYRILWPGWEDFITNTKDDLGNLPAFPVITFSDDDYAIGSTADYLGIPIPPPSYPITISAIPFAAYQCVYNEYYRDQNLIDPVEFELVDGSNDANKAALLAMRKRAWNHDYFTSCLPWAQKGDSVDIPLGQVTLNPDSSNSGRFVEALAHTTAPVGDVVTTGVAPNANITINGTQVVYDPKDTLTVGATTINSLRTAVKVQEWLEKQARGGTRYIESILMHFGVKSSDARLQRPEYITGVKSPIIISEVLNTTGTTSAPQGNMAGHGIAYTQGNAGQYYCEEHGLIIGIMSVMPQTAYMQQMDRMWFRTQDPLDFPWPSFANLGEQEVKVREIYPFTANGEQTFGYIPRYSEFKYANNRVAGEFRSSLKFWHMAREFDAQPTLSQEFIECTPTTRVWAVEAEDDQFIWAHVLNKVSALRKLPKFSIPTF